jgi:hypothetical protein
MEQKANEVASDVELVTVVSPRAFSVMLDHGNLFAFTVGAQEVPAAVADHWYAKAHGVTLYEPLASKKPASESKGVDEGGEESGDGAGGDAGAGAANGGTDGAPEKRRPGRPAKPQP